MGVQNLKWVTWRNHPPFRDILTGTRYGRPVNQIRNLYTFTHYTKILKVAKMTKLGAVSGLGIPQDHRQHTDRRHICRYSIASRGKNEDSDRHGELWHSRRSLHCHRGVKKSQKFRKKSRIYSGGAAAGGVAWSSSLFTEKSWRCYSFSVMVFSG